MVTIRLFLLLLLGVDWWYDPFHGQSLLSQPWSSTHALSTAELRPDLPVSTCPRNLSISINMWTNCPSSSASDHSGWFGVPDVDALPPGDWPDLFTPLRC